MSIQKFGVGDRLIMKKKHPCSSFIFSVIRIGSDVRIVCEGCGRNLTLERTDLEKMIKKVIPADSEN